MLIGRPNVPELTRGADIKLNARVSLRHLVSTLSSNRRPELAGTAHRRLRDQNSIAGKRRSRIPVWRSAHNHETNMAHIQFENNIQWDGKCITVWAVTERGRIKCEIPRATVHSIPRFADAITREIERDRKEIVDRLRPILFAKVAIATGDTIELHPHDLTLT
jgi:hypothetical protein